jgi:small-conductance mechanosensitive channel
VQFAGEFGRLTFAQPIRNQVFAPSRVARRFAILLLLAAIAGLVRSRAALAQSEGAEAKDASLIASERQIATAPVVIDGRVLFKVRGVTAFPAADRAATIAQRIRAVAEDRAIPPSALRLVANDHWIEIVGGENSIMGVFDADAAAEAAGLSRQALAQIYLKNISSALEQYRTEREPVQLARNAFRIAGWTFVLLLVELTMLGGLRWLTVRMGKRYDSAVEQIETGTFRLIRAESIWVTMRFATRLFALVAALTIFYVYLHIALEYLPWTRALSSDLRSLTLAPLLALARKSLAVIPRLLVIVVIVAVARYIIRLARFFFSAIESGAIKFSGFEAEWSKPTYNIVRGLLIAFAAMVCYPYIPGSRSEAFKGITIFVGVLFSLGSSSLLANIIAGYTMAYRRAFHVGDRIKVGDLMGDVTQIGLMVTHMRSIKNEELVVPNSVILNSNVINYASLAHRQGLILHTAVGIGYETPWRQVEAMLLMAAERTPGLLREPAPFVLQLSLNDFAVTYELNVYCDQPSEMDRLYTELHRYVLDVFNEYGVQIMTPAYVADPPEPKIVQREQWFAKPADTGAPLKISKNA